MSNKKEKIMEALVGTECTLMSNDGYMLANGNLTMRKDVNGIPLFDINLVDFVFRATEVSKIEFSGYTSIISLW